jgi:hypothetical protein
MTLKDQLTQAFTTLQRESRLTVDTQAPRELIIFYHIHAQTQTSLPIL